MFLTIDHTKAPQKVRLHLAKPNKQIISNIYERYDAGLEIKLGAINELRFSIPHFIMNDETGKNEKNPHIQLVKERMLIRLKLGTYLEWFIVDSIEEDSNDKDTFMVEAFSLGYEVKRKPVTGFTTDGMNASEMGNELLKDTTWTLGEVDPIFNQMFRSFDSGEDSNVLEAIGEWSKTFGGIVVWNTDLKTISLLDLEKQGRYKGLSVDYGRYLQSIRKTRTTDQMPTRLYIYGSEGLSINSVNPTGMSYIEDFSHYIYPFERDANRNVIKSSDFMSDDLCHALLDHKDIMSNNTPIIQSINTNLLAKQTSLVSEQSVLDELKLELQTILGLLDLAQASGDATLIASRKTERDAKESQVQAQTLDVLALQTEIGALNSQLDVLHDDISHQSNFTPELIEELNYYIEAQTWRDENYIDALELYQDGLKEFERIRSPQIVIEITMDNLFNIVEEQYYWDKLVLGDLIKIKYPQMDIEYMAKIIEISYDLESGEAHLTIANTNELHSDMDRFKQLFDTTKSSTSLLENNKYKWDKINALSVKVNQMITDAWDANKQKIIAGVDNTIEIGNRGVIVRNPVFPNEILIIQSGIIALSKDTGETWKTAITPDGIVAERLMGQIIAGQELLITNSNGSFTMDDNGAIFDVGSFTIRSSSGSNLVDRWQGGSDFVEAFTDDNLITGFEKKMLKIKFDEIETRYNANIMKLNNYYDDAGDSFVWVNDFHNAFDLLEDYLFTVHHDVDTEPMLAPTNMTFTTRVVSSVFNQRFSAYDNAVNEVEAQLALRAKALAQEAYQNAQDAQDNINEVMNDVVYKIELTSSMGLVFRNGQINTLITAKVYRGKEDITSTIPVSGFIWSKTDKNGVLDTVWNTANANVGKQIVITKDDINQRATFQCDVDIPE